MKKLPLILWPFPMLSLCHSHKRRLACEAAIKACRQLNLDEDKSANIVYLVLRALQTGSPAFTSEAVELLNYYRAVRRSKKIEQNKLIKRGLKKFLKIQRKKTK